MIVRNIIALIVTFGASLIWLRINDYFAQHGWVSSRTSRKLIHIGTGPLFVLCWLLFDNAAYARYMAALVPFSITIQFALVGLGVVKDEAAVQAMSRSGDAREILRGPLFYGIVFVLLTIIFWRENPIGIVALMMLCGGDGLAEILGRNFGKTKLPWSRSKSWVGSVGFLAGSLVLTVLVLGVFIAIGGLHGTLAEYLLPVTLIALISTVVESVSPNDVDNLTVPTAAVLLGFILLV
jgi:phytol kinase